MKNLSILTIVLATLLMACGGSPDEGNLTPSQRQKMKLKEEKSAKEDGKGIGEVKNVALNNPLDKTMVSNGEAIYDLKCAACHKLNETRLVGPGWKGVTDRRKPEWIMNMVTNVDVMLEKDPVAQAQLRECLVKMPNQNLTLDDARDVLEFMYANDKGELKSN